MLAERLQEYFGQPFNVINQGQGGGVIGLSSIKNADPDGYTLGVLYNFAHYAAMGQADFDAADFTAIAQFNFDPAGFQVRDDSPWENIEQALDDIQQSPERLCYCLRWWVRGLLAHGCCNNDGSVRC